MCIINFSNGYIIADKVRIAKTFWTRFKGLMFKEKLEKGECLIIQPCNMIHTFGMRFTLDIVFVSKDYKIVSIIENLEPNRMSPMVKDAFLVLELPVGIVQKTRLKVGDGLLIDHLDKEEL